VSESEWIPIGATYDMGAWSVLWARETEDGWEFRDGVVGLAHLRGHDTPGGVKSHHD